MPKRDMADEGDQHIRHDRRNGSGRVRRMLRLAFRASRRRTSGLGTVLALLAGALAWVTALAAVAVTGAWTWVGWQSLRSQARPAPSTLYVMGSATALTAVAIMWPRIEPVLVRALSG